MSSYHQNQPAVAYPSLSTELGPCAAPPSPLPPTGYPTKDGNHSYAQNHSPGGTKSRGDGFWKGCCAALCCCCMLDSCF